MLRITLVGTQELMARLDRMPAAVRSILETKMREIAIQLQTHVQRDKLSGQVLNVVTGALRRSITQTVSSFGDTVVAEVFSAGDVKYAGIHEYGGQTQPHDIYPKSADALHFMIGGQEIFAKVVHHPGSRMPERSFLRSALGDMAPTIAEEIQQAVVQGMDEAT
jgi:phage gpG-like protein